jgi:hypothetical protein
MGSQMERFLDRPKINFGPPRSFEEAMYRLPDSSHPRIKNDFELQLLSSLRQNIENVLQWHLNGPLEDRILRGITEDSFALMERWSFKREKMSTRIYWHHSVIQSQLFNMLPTEKNARKRLYLYDMVPNLDRPLQVGNETYKFVCIEAQYKNENGDVKRKNEYLLGFVSKKEYDLLHESTLS